ncbi:serine/threonine-protein kinase M1 [Ascosphaera pollenicola]|nr:serine/threonine-protein kinase M1 [Ascosphaera pollenicola]
MALGSPLKEEMQASSPSRGESREGEKAQEDGAAKDGARSRPSSSSSSSSLTSNDGDKDGTGIATELDIGEFGAELQREAELDQHRSRSRVPSIAHSHSSSERSYDGDEGPIDDSGMLGLRETNNSPYPFARPPKQFESPAQSVSSLHGITPSRQLDRGKGSPMPNLNPRHQATVEDAEEVETNPSIIHGATSNPAASPGQIESPREALLPEPLVPGGGSGSLRYNPDYMHSQEDYGRVVREETVPSPRDTSERAVNRPGAATTSGVSAALATAALVAGLDPEKMAKGSIGFERSFIGSRGTDMSFPEGYEDHSRQYSSSSESTNPMFESAGKAFDSIENKDIMTLMQHLTVRDAQRNARDTEILFTLVRSAADMRNSFEEMKRFIAQQDEVIMEANDRQHQATQRAINGPRPPPAGFTRRTTAALIAEEEENRSKKRNVFKRAMKGLSGKNSNELTKIEDMLYHLLIEVEQLRQGQAGGQGQVQPLPSAHVVDNTHMPPVQLEVPQRSSIQEKRHSLPPPDTTSANDEMASIRLVPSHDRSSIHSHDQRPKSFHQQSFVPTDPGLIIDRGLESHQPHRVSPIHEADERSCKTADRDDAPLTPEEERYIDKTRIVDENSLRNKNRAPNGLIPSPRVSYSDMNDSSNGDNQTSYKPVAPIETAKDEEQHEKKMTGFFKKFKKGFARKDRTRTEPASGAEEDNDQDGADREQEPKIMKPRRASADQDQNNQAQGRPPSPLIPSEISGLSGVSEAPRYRVHRDGTNLLHPKPRPYATEHHKNQLESEAQHFVVQSPKLDDWASISTATGMSHRKDSGASQFNYHRRNLSDPMSPTSDVNSVASQPRRAQRVREKDDGPLVPERSNGGYSSYGSASRSNAYQSPSSGSAGNLSPNPGGAPQRKLTGPRPLTSTSARSSNYQPNRRWSRSPELAEDY